MCEWNCQIKTYFEFSYFGLKEGVVSMGGSEVNLRLEATKENKKL